ncbi:MAG: hypothetical protein R2911_01040 [Caldilineaceae bacterium]
MTKRKTFSVCTRLLVLLALMLANFPQVQIVQTVYAQSAAPTDPSAPKQTFLPVVSTGANKAAHAANAGATTVPNTATSGQEIFLPAVSSGAATNQPAAAPVATEGQVQAAATGALRLRVESAREWVPSGLALHQPILHYHWMVVQDDTGDPTHYGTSLGATDIRNSNYACKPQSLGGDPDYPANCQWPAIHSVKGGTSAEVVAQGDETTLNETLGIDTSGWPANDLNPNHSYMISVMAEGFDIPGCTVTADVTCHVDGFKIDGQWFTLPTSGADVMVTVDMQPYPLPLTTVRMAVWNDIQTNGAYDTGEPTLAGFEGHIDDVLGPVTTDWYGNPFARSIITMATAT